MMADPPSEWRKVTSITTTDYLAAMPTPSAGFGVLVVSKQTRYEGLKTPSREYQQRRPRTSIWSSLSSTPGVLSTSRIRIDRTCSRSVAAASQRLL
jgi:hypothetical protein